MSAFTVDAMSGRDVDDVARIESVSFAPGEPGARGPARIREELVRKWTYALVARENKADSRALGFLLAWHVVDELHILDLAVDPDARRRGVGRALVAAAITYAKSNEIVRVLLEVRASNAAAIALYTSAGFAEHGVRKRYYSDDEDAVEMMLTL